MSEGEDTENESTGLPGLRSWRAVYTITAAIAVAYVALLAVLTGWYR